MILPMRRSHRHVLVQGFALPTVLVMLTLTSLATLLALRQLWMNDQLISAHADQLRTIHLAHAVRPLAVADILGAPTSIASDSDTVALMRRHTAGDDTQSHVFFPNNMSDYTILRGRLLAADCNAGICVPSLTFLTNAHKASTWKAQRLTAWPLTSDPSLSGNTTGGYWVEIFPPTDSSNPSPNFVYRITVLADGVLPASTTVLQGIWQRNTSTSSTGRWHSWQLLQE